MCMSVYILSESLVMFVLLVVVFVVVVHSIGPARSRDSPSQPVFHPVYRA